MAMTKEERGTKNWLYQHLLEEGYRTYAKLFWELDFHLTANPNVVGYMEPKTGTITVNRTLEADQISVIIRHEILHGFLQHEKRLLQNLAQKRGLDFDDLSDMDINELKAYLYQNKNFNIAGDYEISNLGYTEEDKDVIRNILLNGQTVSGLVTEDRHPDWVDLSIEEMYDRLQDAREDDQQQTDPPQDPPEGEDEGDGSDGQSPETPQTSLNGGDSQGGDGEGDTPQQPTQDEPETPPDDGGGQGSTQQPPQNKTQPPHENGNGDNSNPPQTSAEDNPEPKSNSAESEKPRYVYGKFIDKNTFLDANGNIVTIG